MTLTAGKLGRSSLVDERASRAFKVRRSRAGGEVGVHGVVLTRIRERCRRKPSSRAPSQIRVSRWGNLFLREKKLREVADVG